MQRRSRQVRDRGLQGIETVIQRQERMATERNHRRLLFLGPNRRSRFLRLGLEVLDRRPLAPLRDRLGVDAQLPAQLRERSRDHSGHPSNRWRAGPHYCCSDGVPSPWCSNQWRTMARSWRCRDELVPQCILPFLRKDRTIKPWDQTPKKVIRSSPRRTKKRYQNSKRPKAFALGHRLIIRLFVTTDRKPPSGTGRRASPRGARWSAPCPRR